MLAGLGGQQHQERTEALPAGLHQVARRARHERRAAADVDGQGLLDHGHPVRQPARERLVGHRHRQARQPVASGGVGHLMNSPATRARSSTGPGTRPMTRVAAAEIPIVVAESTDGWATYALSESGSWKYITMITRT